MPWPPRSGDFANVFGLVLRRARRGRRGTCLAVTGDRTDKRLSRSVLRGWSSAAKCQQAAAGETHMKNLFNRFVREEQGQDLIEYALLAGLISLVCVVAITNVGTKVNALFVKVQNAIP
jgi:pilus assembly protein Flp/PilA